MFEVTEEEIQRLADEYEIGDKVVRRYATLLQSSTLIPDQDTFNSVLEEAIQISNPLPTWPHDMNETRGRGRSAESVLKKALLIVVGSDDDSIAEDVECMLGQEEEKQQNGGRGSK